MGLGKTKLDQKIRRLREESSPVSFITPMLAQKLAQW